MVFMARHVLRRIDFPLEAAQTLGVAVAPALQFASYVLSLFAQCLRECLTECPIVAGVK